ncbi:transcriptional regulator [Lysinibacillus sp. 3P01SB]|uniref:transcriptional regulator n=1 Tax=Lysinibacillus sp. 3P01SB TaxID=3132284 RepID=UPI0039A74D54
MREQILKAMKRHQLIDVIYMAKNGDITKRRVKVLKMAGGSLQVYCYTKNAKRTLILEQVLAVKPVILKERGVI